MSISATSLCILNPSRDGDYTTALGSLFQFDSVDKSGLISPHAIFLLQHYFLQTLGNARIELIPFKTCFMKGNLTVYKSVLNLGFPLAHFLLFWFMEKKDLRCFPGLFLSLFSFAFSLSPFLFLLSLFSFFSVQNSKCLWKYNKLCTMLLKKSKRPQKPEAGCCSVWSALKIINIKRTKRWLRDCNLLWRGKAGCKGRVDTCKVVKKVFLVAWTVLPSVDVTHGKTAQASARVNGTPTFSIFFQVLSQYVLFQTLQFSPPCSWFFCSLFSASPPITLCAWLKATHPIYFIHPSAKRGTQLLSFMGGGFALFCFTNSLISGKEKAL